MTFEEKIKELLMANGMFNNQAEDVFLLMKADKANEPMRDRWNDDISGYPKSLINVAWMSAKRSALKYIEEIIPQAWFKPMFMDKPEAK